jgi:hypothetical protein
MMMYTHTCLIIIYLIFIEIIDNKKLEKNDEQIMICASYMSKR